ncbi:MAG: DNA polymerase IV [Spirochaetia bacterium]|jgi:DNA polymerase-4|nr:DNA polymerase IV [Spirochaetia bacterium]
MDNVFFHVDMDAFYAAIEQLDNPALRGKPVVVGGTGKRGVVSTCSYEARAYGVRSAMPAGEAKKRCPSCIFVPVRMNRYLTVSRQIMEILKSFSPEVNKVSIDEAYLDMTGTGLIFGTPHEAALKLKTAVKEKTGLTISVGIARNRMLAKLASEYGKPDGLYQIEKGKEIEFLDSVKLKDLWGVGKKMVERLQELGISDIKQLRSYSKKMLCGMLGDNAAEYIYKIVRGEDPGIWNDCPKSRSISSETTFEKDTSDITILKRELLDISRQLMFRLMETGCTSKTVAIKIKYHDFVSVTARNTISANIMCSDEIYKVLLQLLESKLDRSKPVRLIGAALMSLEDEEKGEQLDLFESSYSKKREVEKAVQALSKKKPGIKIFKATLINKQGL